MELKDFLHLFITVSGGLLSLIGFLVWRILHRIESKLEELHDMTHSCRETLPERFLSRTEHTNYQNEFDKLWDALNYHEHNPNGRVIRS